jgi:tetratricopeptide (TPR) repeat protein
LLLACLAGAFLLPVAAPRSRGAEGVAKGLPDAYEKVMTEAAHAFLARDFKTALAQLDEADEIVPNTPMALNTRGAIAIEEKHFDEGRKYCEAALVQAPKYFPARFNLGEIPFLQKQYAEARKVFSELLAEDPKNELLAYRVFLTYLLEKNDAAAKAELDKMKLPGTTGAGYYAHGAWEFAHGNSKKAMIWLHAGDFIYSPDQNLYLAEVLCDLGWIGRPKPALPAESPAAVEKQKSVDGGQGAAGS